MNVASILQAHGLVPSVPSPRREVGTTRALVASLVPNVPTVPAERSKGAAARVDVRPDLHAIRGRLLDIARTLGIPRVVVDALPVEELEATAEQAELCKGYVDGNGDPLAQSLLVFYLKELAGRPA